MRDGTQPSDPRLIVALDFPDARAATGLATRLDPGHCAVKVGFELFVAEGPALVERLQEMGFRVFLDLKFHDIPNTVAAACRAAARLGVWMLNVHAGGGLEMMRSALEGVRAVAPQSRLIAVTVLTASDAATLRSVGIDRSPDEQVLWLADLAIAQAGLDGLVCSALEAERLRRALGPDPWLVTPGIRPAGAGVDDQKRIATPAAAIRAGASHLVVGRPISRAPDPALAAARLLAEIESASGG
ncbi:orotidine-5'-phosphate decarboxylase [Thioalkalivibrio paradoxus]|uniref:Orotidine 5'-phosphate decarboxylase n=1 Tax=Thioalkalivibrio paradoxus ARh 1 TaxID=713585 RepID=W0DMK9_9GAMM|nr:orotidine 5'-phosphate decarboxylase [Thioalkalivibrio paradoxus ARh 1]